MAKLMEARDFEEWTRRAAPGHRRTYYRGYMARDIAGVFIGGAALRAFERGLVHLFQRKHGYMDYEYIAVKRREA
jgi:hypothetical protein